MGNQPSTPRPGAKLQVIGAGLPRTGTSSFTEALRILLDGPVYHGGTQMTVGPESDILSWMKIFSLRPAKTEGDHAAMSKMLRQSLDGFVACTDVPGCNFVPELLEEYPDALVVCTTRDPAVWERSMSHVAGVATMWFLGIVMMPLPTMRYWVGYTDALRGQYEHLYGERGSNLKVYHRHVEWLKKTVPADRLVFYDVSEGWEPLCEALGKEVPDVEFPRINDKDDTEKYAAKLVRRGLQRWAMIIGGVGVLVASGWFYMSSK